MGSGIYEWALILGGSSGFGYAAARKLAASGMGVFLVHRDLRGEMPRVEASFDEIRAYGGKFASWNGNALDEAGRGEVVTRLKERLGAEGRVKLLLHSIAQGNLRRTIASGDEPALSDEDIASTVYAMGTSLVSYARELARQKLFAPDARVLSLSSEGSRLAVPRYAAVAAAKAALEAVTRSLAVELAPLGVRCNVIQAGVTDTPALRKVPGAERMKAHAVKRNPFGRLTTPGDVADFIYLLTRPEAAWVNGATLCCDGGESVSLSFGGADV